MYDIRNRKWITKSKAQYLEDYRSHHAVDGAFADDYYFERVRGEGRWTPLSVVNNAMLRAKADEEDVRRVLLPPVMPPIDPAVNLADEDPGWEDQAEEIYKRFVV